MFVADFLGGFSNVDVGAVKVLIVFCVWFHQRSGLIVNNVGTAEGLAAGGAGVVGAVGA